MTFCAALLVTLDVDIGQVGKFLAFVRGNVVEYISWGLWIGEDVTGLDFYENKFVLLLSNQVNFAVFDFPIPRDDLKTLGAEIGFRNALGHLSFA